MISLLKESVGVADKVEQLESRTKFPRLVLQPLVWLSHTRGASAEHHAKQPMAGLSAGLRFRTRLSEEPNAPDILNCISFAV